MKKQLLLSLMLLSAGLSASAESLNTTIDNVGKMAFDTETHTATLTEAANVAVVQVPASFPYDDETYSVTRIGMNAFNGKDNVSFVVIPNSVTSMGDGVFSNCSALQGVQLDQTQITVLPANAFSGSANLNLVSFPTTLETIGNMAFYGCTSLQAADFRTVTSIGLGAYAGCSSLTSISIPETVTTISNNAFQNCTGLTSANVQANISILPSFMFDGCTALTNVTLSPSLTFIYEYTFKDCTSLTNITLPANITGMASNAFALSAGKTRVMESITFEGAVNQTLASSVAAAFNGTDMSHVAINVPEGTNKATVAAAFGISTDQILDGTEGQEPEVPAAKQYVQVTSREQLGQGGRYAMACVGTHASYPLYYTVSSTGAQTGVKPADLVPTESEIWEFERPSAKHTCVGGHTTGIHGSVFTLKNGSHYLKFGSTTATTAIENNNYVEFVPSVVTTVNDIAGQYFVLHCEWSEANGYFLTNRGITATLDPNNGMTASKFSAPSGSNANLWDKYTYVSNGTTFTQHSTVHAVYIELDPEHPEVAAGALWNGKFEENVLRWAETFSEDIESAIRANIPALPDIAWDLSSLAALQAQIDDEYNKVVRNVINQAATGRTFHLYNVGSSAYLTVNAEDGDPFVVGTEKSVQPFAFVANAAGDAFKIRYGNTSRYLGAMPADQEVFTEASATEAGEFVIDIFNSDTGACFIRAKGADATDANTVNMHANNTSTTSLKGYHGTGSYSQWKLSVPVPKEEYDAYHDNALTALTNLGACGLWTSNEIAAVRDAIGSIEWDETKTTVYEQSAEAARCKALVDEHVNSLMPLLWDKFNDHDVMIKNHVNSNYVATNTANSLCLSGTRSDKTVWHIEHIADNQFYMSQDGKYINGTAAGTALSETEKAIMSFEITSEGKVQIRNNSIVDETDHRYLFNGNTASPTTLYYWSTDNGCYLDFVMSISEVPEYTSLTTAVENALTTVGDNHVAGHLLNKYLTYKRTAMNEAYAALAEKGLVYGIFADIDEVTALKDDFLTKEAIRDGMLIRIKSAMPNNTAFIHYSTATTSFRNGNNTWQLTKADIETKTDENSILLWKGERIITLCNGMYMYTNSSNNNYVAFRTSANDNTSTAQVRFLDATTLVDGAYQMVVGDNMNIHLHGSENDYGINRCTQAYSSGVKTGDANHNLIIEVVDEVPVTVNTANGVGSVMCPVALDVPEGCYAWIATMDGSSISWTPATHIKANEHAVIYAPNHQSGKMKLLVSATKDAADDTANHAHLRGHYVARTHSTTDFPKLYVLNVGGANPASAPALYAAEDDTEAPAALEMPTNVTLTKVTATGSTVAIPAGTLAVHVTSTQFNDDELSLPLDDTVNLNEVATSISEISAEEGADAVYDLQGRRLSAPRKGAVNIINGKKIFVY